MYDVIVVGAGPTGCTAAKLLAEKGYTVLLAERCRLPRYKSCSGILIQRAMTLVEQYFGEPTPDNALCTPTDNRGMVFVDERGREFRFEQEGRNIWRAPFDHWLAQKAAASGAQVRDGTAVIDCDERADGVVVTLRGERTYTETARYVVDCEGVTGSLKRRLTGRRETYITTFQTFNRGEIALDPHYFYAYLQPEFSQYDAWFNVKDDWLILGVSVRDGGDIDGYYARFLQFMQERHGLRIDEQVRGERWLMPCIRPGCPVEYGRGRVLFAGEVAGFLHPMGEGISAGLASGGAAALAIDRCGACPHEVVAAYRDEVAAEQAYMQRQWWFTARMAQRFQDML